MNAKDSEEFLDLRGLVDKLWAHRWWMFASVAVFTIASVAYALTADRVYRASTVLAPAQATGGQSALGSILGQMGGLASLAGVDAGNNGANTEEALAVLRSRDFTLRFFEDEQILPKIFPEDWDTQRQRWIGDAGPPSISRAYELFDKRIRRVVQNKKTGLTTIEIDWTDRTEAAAWANGLISRLNQEMRTRAINNANESLRFLEKELAATAVVEMRESINRLIEGQIRQRMLANVNHEYAFRVIDRAVVPEADEPVRPRRRNIVMIGFALGFVFGAVCLVLFDYFKRGRD